ncbi:MAG: beta-lactamase family protein [Reichenbachiella sp.]
MTFPLKSSRILLFMFVLTACQNKGGNEHQSLVETNEHSLVLDSLTRDLESISEAGNIVGFSVALVDQNQTYYMQGFGSAEAELGNEYSETTIQNVASISKTFIGVALLKAQELQLLKLDDPINEYLPFEVKNPFSPNEPITIRHLATHTSTIKDTQYYGDKSYVLKEENVIEDFGMYVSLNPPEEHMPMMDMMKNVLLKEGKWYDPAGFLETKPGTDFEYSNIGATLAAVVLEQASGQKFDEFTSQHVFQPLGMNATGWSFDQVNLAAHTKLYTSSRTQIPFYSLITYPDGGLITSVADLGKYLSELIRGSMGKGAVLKRESYQELFQPQLENEEHNEGIFMSLPPSGLVGHSGGDPGVSTFMFFDPKTKNGRILFANTELDKDGEKQYRNILAKLKLYQEKVIRNSKTDSH